MTYAIQYPDGSVLLTEDYNVALEAVPDDQKEDFRLACLRFHLQPVMERVGERD